MQSTAALLVIPLFAYPTGVDGCFIGCVGLGRQLVARFMKMEDSILTREVYARAFQTYTENGPSLLLGRLVIWPSIATQVIICRASTFWS